ncbi:hypothetical protein [Halorubellus salinus]|uniref:hypothetical protein n=1 Tax=Halorubellus salinus TaxID=755309 RepID=UPI001D078F54|nr:hypothetical protein [Halorubellus salinus]
MNVRRPSVDHLVECRPRGRPGRRSNGFDGAALYRTGGSAAGALDATTLSVSTVVAALLAWTGLALGVAARSTSTR